MYFRSEPAASLTPQPLTIHYKPFIPNTTPKSIYFEKEPEFHPVPVQYRPPKPVKPRKPQHHQHIQEEVLEQKSAPRLHQPVRQHLPKQSYDGSTEKRKPVAQIIKKYRKDNDDGSITWGFENDDGSYKEEIIGGKQSIFVVFIEKIMSNFFHQFQLIALQEANMDSSINRESRESTNMKLE